MIFVWKYYTNSSENFLFKSVHDIDIDIDQLYPLHRGGSIRKYLGARQKVYDLF